MADIKAVQPTINEAEALLLKQYFKDNEFILKKIRSLLFGFEIDSKSKKIIKDMFKDESLKKSFRKKIFPIFECNEDIAIGQVVDFWGGTESNIFGGSRDVICQTITSKEKLYSMLTQAIDLLSNPDGKQVDLNIVKNLELDPLQCNLLARNLYIKTIETGLYFIKTISDMKTEDLKAVKEKIAKDSAK